MKDRELYTLALLLLRSRGRQSKTGREPVATFMDNVITVRWWSDTDDLIVDKRLNPLVPYRILSVRGTTRAIRYAEVLYYREDEEVSEHIIKLMPLEAMALL